MYILVCGHGFGNTLTNYDILGESSSLEELKKKRAMSGELVFNKKTLEIVKDNSWLFDWEKEESECYAQKMISANTVLVGSYC